MLPNSELEKLGDFITERLPVQGITFGVVHKKKKTLFILDSFGDFEHFETYYKMFEPVNGKKVSDEYDLFDPIANDVLETISIFMEDKNVRWQFGMTLTALAEIRSMAKLKGHL